MFVKLLILFTVVPVVEIFLLVQAGQTIGTLYTIGIVIITGIAGAAFAKSQGARIFHEIKEAAAQGEIPGNELVQGGLVLAGGIMLLTPGFLTDITGFSLLIPLTRKLYTKLVIAYFKKRIQKSQWRASEDGTYYSTTDYTVTYEADYEGEAIEHPKLEE